MQEQSAPYTSAQIYFRISCVQMTRKEHHHLPEHLVFPQRFQIQKLRSDRFFMVRLQTCKLEAANFISLTSLRNVNLGLWNILITSSPMDLCGLNNTKIAWHSTHRKYIIHVCNPASVQALFNFREDINFRMRESLILYRDKNVNFHVDCNFHVIHPKGSEDCVGGMYCTEPAVHACYRK